MSFFKTIQKINKGETIEYKETTEDKEIIEIENDNSKKNEVSLSHKKLLDLISTNLELVEKGLIPIEKEFNTKECGKIDLVCRDINKDIVIIEVKPDKTNDSTIGQLLRYVSWYRTKTDRKIRGVIVASCFSKDIKYSIKMVKFPVILIKYRSIINLELNQIESKNIK